MTETDPLSPQQPLWCAVCFATITSLDEQVYREPCYPQTAFHLDHLFDKKASVRCHIHRSENLRLHCESCSKLLCYTCSVNSKHRYHACRHADTKFEQLKSALKPLQDESMGVISESSRMLAELNESEEKLMQQKSLVSTQVEQKFHDITVLLETKKKELLSQLEDISLKQEKSIADGKEMLSDIRVSVSNCLDSVRRNLSSGSIAGVAELVATTRKDLSQHKFETKVLPDIRCTISTKDLVGCMQAWKVYAQDVSSGNCYANGDGVNRATLNKAARFDLYTRNSDNKTCEPVPCPNVECELVHEGSGASIRGSTVKSEGGHYLVNYTPRLSGDHLLDVRVEGQSIRGSPFQVTVQDRRCPVATIADVQGPWGVAINQRGQIVVAENTGNCISMFDSERKKVNLATSLNSSQALQQKSIKKCDTENVVSSDLHHPSEVVVDHQGNILVANRHKHTIVKFQADGTFVRAKGMGNKLEEDFFYPTGITIHPISNKIYVTDTFKHRIRVLNPDLSDDQTFGKHGDQEGAEFVYPTSVACDSKGNVYVVDSGNNRIQVFTSEGKHVTTFGHFGHRDGKLHRPVGIAIDKQDKLYVSDRGNHRICVFTCEGDFVSAFYSTAGDNFDPSAMAVDSSGVLHVCSYKQGEVQLFHV